MTIQKKELFIAELSDGITATAIKTVEYFLPDATFEIRFEWANGELVKDTSELSFKLKDIQELTILFNQISDYRNN